MTHFDTLIRGGRIADGSGAPQQLAVGLRAVLNLIDLSKLVAHAPRLTYDLPTNMPRLSQQVEGYVSTWVRGEVVQDRGVLAGARPGRLLRSRAS